MIYIALIYSTLSIVLALIAVFFGFSKMTITIQHNYPTPPALQDYAKYGVLDDEEGDARKAALDLARAAQALFLDDDQLGKED